MNTLEIMKDIHWVGAIDWDLRDFHGYSTEKGSTYNAFLVIDKKTTLVDTVKKKFSEELFARIREVNPSGRIDYFVLNHAEMDHTGSLPEVFRAFRPEKIVCSAPCRDAIIEHFGKNDWPFHVVRTGDTLSLGKRTVRFIETKMLHWPDSMFSFLEEDRLLISSDAFGQHFATGERFDDEVDPSELMKQAAKYYANILLPYSGLAAKLLESIKAMGLKIDMIAPDHGLIWRKGVTDILKAYGDWSSQKVLPKAVVAYSTMWDSTTKMAAAVADGLISQGIEVKAADLRGWHRSDVMTELLDSGAFIVGSPTLNNGYLPAVADLLCYARGLKPLGKIGAAFGSYGWGGEAVKLLNEELERMKVELVHQGVRVRYVPTPEDLENCRLMGVEVGRTLRERLGF
ncbi:MAG TPA: flavodoxin domain-containing protein [Synergistales bacterium]|nr:MBL fold metallo-hydrolase [Synergistaceae bacterium]HQQ10468.1 flavodoxin domain-containing protein [Synergistales bacterium]